MVTLQERPNSYRGQEELPPRIKISNSDFWVLAASFVIVGGIGVWEGEKIHPIFYSLLLELALLNTIEPR